MTGQRLGAAVALTFGLGLVVGCGGDSPPKPLGQESLHLLKLAQVYHSYKAKNKGTPPATAEDLKKWAAGLKPDELQKLGVTDVEDAFISPRDKQPYQYVKPGNDMRSKMGAQQVLFYEKEGVGGKHLTVGGMGNAPREMDREALKQTVPNYTGT